MSNHDNRSQDSQEAEEFARFMFEVNNPRLFDEGKGAGGVGGEPYEDDDDYDEKQHYLEEDDDLIIDDDDDRYDDHDDDFDPDRDDFDDNEEPGRALDVPIYGEPDPSFIR